MAEQKFKSRSLPTELIDEVDALAISQAEKIPGSKPRSTPDMLAIAWQFFKEHNYGKT